MPMFWHRPGSKAAPEKRWRDQGVAIKGQTP